MIKIYGASDDLVEIENSQYPEDEIGCYGYDVKLSFADGTEILIGYSKPHVAVWYINIITQGSARQLLTICNDENAEPYSDIFEIDAEVISHELVS